jgi:basic amino acid/polyamine antiporter, APA family
MSASDPGGTESGTATPQLFARNATGLVRGVSPRSSLVINFIPGHPAQSLAAGFFFVFALFPGGNYLLGLLMVIPMALAMSYAFGLLTAMIPRSGGDYMQVSRVIHPAVGLISSFCMTLAGLLSNAFFGIAFVTIGLAPGLTGVGLIDGNATLVRWGTEITSKHWIIVLGILMMVGSSLILAGGWRWTLRVQNTIFWLVTGSLFLSVLIALFTSHSTFIANFDHFAQSYTHSKHTYQDVITNAHKAGVNTSPPFSFTNTIPIMGFFATFSIFSYWSTFIGGELRQANTMKTANNMAIAGVGGILIVAVFAVIFFHTFGTPFMIAANGGGMPPTLALTATYFSLISASVGNTFLAVVLFGCYVLFWPLICYISFIQPTRMLFAYAFDGILPYGVTRTTKSGSPYVAVIITFVMSAVTLVWAVYGSNFFQVLVYATLVQLIAMGLVGLSAVVVPYTKPDLYRASATKLKVLGIPVVSIAGAGAIATCVAIWILYFHYPVQFGLVNKEKMFLIFGGTIALAIVYYLVARAVRRTQGVDLALAYAEVPPE